MTPVLKPIALLVVLSLRHVYCLPLLVSKSDLHCAGALRREHSSEVSFLLAVLAQIFYAESPIPCLLSIMLFTFRLEAP